MPEEASGNSGTKHKQKKTFVIKKQTFTAHSVSQLYHFMMYIYIQPNVFDTKKR